MHRIIAVLLLLAGLGAATARAEDVQLADNPPSRYVVTKGDTLWGIAGKFLKSPWKWPQVWGMNKDNIRNPHWIYPGDVIVLDMSSGSPRLRLEGDGEGGAGAGAAGAAGTGGGDEVLRPRVRSEALSALAIPTIPPKVIEPFLLRPLVIDARADAGAPTIVAAEDGRVVVSTGDLVYAQGLKKGGPESWQIYRTGRTFTDPKTREVLGLEAIYLGDATVTQAGSVSALRVARTNQEVTLGDRLAQAPVERRLAYVPHAPDRTVSGLVIAGTDATVAEMGPYSVILINRGAREGMEVGHVLGLYRSEGEVTGAGRHVVKLPEQEYGLVLLFRVFNKMSYGLVVQAHHPVEIEDRVGNP